MLKDNGINQVKLFDSDPWTLSSLAGTGMEVMVAIPNKDMARYLKYKKAKQFVKHSVSKYLHDGGVDIR